MVAVKETLSGIPSLIRDHIKDIFSNMIDTVVSLPGKIKGYIVDLRDTVLENCGLSYKGYWIYRKK